MNITTSIRRVLTLTLTAATFALGGCAVDSARTEADVVTVCDADGTCADHEVERVASMSYGPDAAPTLGLAKDPGVARQVQGLTLEEWLCQVPNPPAGLNCHELQREEALGKWTDERDTITRPEAQPSPVAEPPYGDGIAEQHEHVGPGVPVTN